MARQSLVLDASVGVKWFSATGEGSLAQALSIRDSHITGHILIIVPELFYYEVANAIVYKQSIPLASIQAAATSMFDLGMEAVPLDAGLLETSVKLSRELSITIYDSCYLALAQKVACPLVTANPRHQKQVPGCDIIPIEKWRI
jgi:predicted nucleic acid-binding protein